MVAQPTDAQLRRWRQHLANERAEAAVYRDLAQRREGVANIRDNNGDWRTERGAYITNHWASNDTITIRRPITKED